MWDVFGKHHYLSNEFNKAASVYLVYWNDTLVAMNSILNVPNGSLKHMFRSHRLVVLPDYQGLGIGTKINDFFGKWFLDKGYRYCMRTTHMKLINHMSSNKCWKPTSNNGKNNMTRCTHNMKYANIMTNQKMLERVCASYEYMGEEYVNKPYKEYYIDKVADKYIEELKNELIKLKEQYFVRIIHGIPTEDDNVDLLAQSLGIVVEPLYQKKNGEYVIKNKYKNKEIISKIN